MILNQEWDKLVPLQMSLVLQSYCFFIETRNIRGKIISAFGFAFYGIWGHPILRV